MVSIPAQFETFNSGESGISTPEESPLQMAYLDTIAPSRRQPEVLLAQANSSSLTNYTLPPSPFADKFSPLLSETYRDTSNSLSSDVAFQDLSIQAMSGLNKSVAITRAESFMRSMITNADTAWQSNSGEKEGFERLFVREHLARILEMGNEGHKKKAAELRKEISTLAIQMGVR